jgi:carbon monoxide dehydrogenase subunit G
MDADFVAASGPGVESVERIDPTHYRVVSGLGVGVLRIRFTMHLELSDIVQGRQVTMRARGKAPGSTVEVVSTLRLEDAGPDRTRLNWAATSDLTGGVAGVGGRLLEGTARRLTEGFWSDFARRVSAG